MGLKSANTFLCGFVFCLLMVGCAGFSYRFYGLELFDYTHGTLLGPSAKDDLPFSRCAPDKSSAHKCVIMFTPDFYSFKKDYIDTQNKLKTCEKNLQTFTDQAKAVL